MDLYRVNLNLLIALDILFLEQSVTRAAKKLFITQAAMSNNLQQLRVLFKDDLLVRDKHKMVLTQFASELQPKLHQVLQEVQSLVVTGQRFDAKTSERVFKIGISDYLASLLLPKLITCLQKQAPKIKLIVVSINYLKNMEPFERGEYDLAIGKMLEGSDFVNKKLLFKDTVVCIMNPKHSLANKKTITLKDYLSHKHIAVRADNPYTFPVVEQELAKLGYSRDIQVNLPFIVPIFKLIEQSENLIATVIRSMTGLYKKNHAYISKELPFKLPEIDFYMAWHQRFDNDPAHQWLRERMSEIGHLL